MRYIITKDALIDISNFTIKREVYENGELLFYEFWTDRSMDRKVIQLSANEVIKKTDTIEELCDEFVIIKDKKEFALARYYSGDRTFYLRTEDEEVSLSECLRYEYQIYGAIWTEWGLKYVAKMNDKGELELL